MCGPVEGAFNTFNSELETTTGFGSYGGIQQLWSDRFRSSLAYGYVDSDSPEFVSGDTFDNTNYVASLLILSGTPIKRSLSALNTSWGDERTRTERPGPPIDSFFPPGLISEAAHISFKSYLRFF